MSGSIVQLTDLNDFISPSPVCVKPIELPKSTKPSTGGPKIQIQADGQYSQVDDDGTSTILEKATITLNDCLACSGCVTSAESVLVEMQTYKELESVLLANKIATSITSSSTLQDMCVDETSTTIVSDDQPGMKPNVGTDDDGLKIQMQEKRLESEKHKHVVVSLSPQSVASLAVKYNTTTTIMGRQITGFLKDLGVHKTYDTTFSRAISLIETQNEFVERFKSAQQNRNNKLPMLASACPGWICYAEKTHGDFILPYISTTKSPQQIMGSLVKHFDNNNSNTITINTTNADAESNTTINTSSNNDNNDNTNNNNDDVDVNDNNANPNLYNNNNTGVGVGVGVGMTPNDTYHVAVMPCLDKKLEASREDFYSDMYESRDVDCVITTGELELFAQSVNVSIENHRQADFDHPVAGFEHAPVVHSGGGSGGYLEHVFRHAAKTLFNIDNAPIVYESRRNPDFREVKLVVDGVVKLRFASAFGFKSIQTVVRQMKRNKCAYDYIEVMACPKGCNNGGGQLKQLDDTISAHDHFVKVEGAYVSNAVETPESNQAVRSLYSGWLNNAAGRQLMHTAYHEVKKEVIPQFESW